MNNIESKSSNNTLETEKKEELKFSLPVVHTLMNMSRTDYVRVLLERDGELKVTTNPDKEMKIVSDGANKFIREGLIRAYPNFVKALNKSNDTYGGGELKYENFVIKYGPDEESIEIIRTPELNE